MKEKVYLEIEKFSPLYSHFIFFDKKEYLADQLFIRHKVRIRFGDEFTKPGSPYRAIFCYVRKRDVPKFLAALEELKNSMCIFGYTDYVTIISGFIEHIEKKKGAYDCEDYSPQKTEQTRTA